MTHADPRAPALSTTPTLIASVRWRLGANAATRALLELRLLATDPLAPDSPAPDSPAATAKHCLIQTLLHQPDNEARQHAADHADLNWLRDHARRLVHLDAGHALAATFDLAGPSPILIYARSNAIERLGLRGGRYGLDGGQLQLA